MYESYIIASYAVTFTLLGGVAGFSFVGLVRVRRALAAFEKAKA